LAASRASGQYRCLDTQIAPRLKESGRKVVVLLIDALRYELGMELEKELMGTGKTTMQTAFAQLPSITRVGMASLLPDAGADLNLSRKDGQLLVLMGEKTMTQATQRMDVLRKRFGDRFAEMQLADFVRGQGSPNEGVELFILRSNSIDQHMESAPEAALKLTHDALKQIRVAIHKLRALGFKEAFVLTDHGFFLNTGAEVGDVCVKPQGNWLPIHERCLLGDGVSDAGNFVVPAQRVGIRGDFNQFAGPRAMVSYRAGEWYFHGGASLQETVVPVINIQLSEVAEAPYKLPDITLSYKRGATKITTRLPVIEVSVAQPDLFSTGQTYELLLEAYGGDGKIVGEAKAGDKINPATHTLSVKPGSAVSVTLRMDDDFEGRFVVKASDPTTMKTYCQLELKTDYTV
jgi:hypothetical protein